MPNPQQSDVSRAVQRLSDRAELQQRGIDAGWIAKCERLVREISLLKTRFGELEAQLCDPGSAVSDDTMLI